MKTLLFFLILLSNLCFASDVKKEKYIVGLENINYPPFSYSKAEKVTRSYFRDVLDAFAQTENIEFKYKTLPVKRLFQEFIERKIDFKIPDNEYWFASKKGESAIAYSQSIYTTTEAVYTQKDIKTVSSMVIILGFAPPIPSNLHKDIKIYTTPKLESAIQMMTEGRVQSIFISKDVLNNSAPNNTFVESPHFPSRDTAYKLSSIIHPELVMKFDKWFSNNSEKIKKIKLKYNLL
ncbi:ABC transporter, substrate-binding protein, family 3 [Bacteriovorax sp. BSW11_IV]|uniref:transporter substrate-binding domain-containing protein n=1 Tax=Bacteriovorax sp. BSW11_IV TaxID=1353529 RepID=UPI000389F616|nr:transporter substrate-binding domain-containing protein [Bacteriovorax sp. BSW11_IV]EQC50293.1 ABC transporter, substrate-binding protein, family 3 [Bacteriovorax sp. BSW11_IV]